MQFLDLTLDTLAANLALDEALLLQAEADGRELLRVWEWPSPAVVLGAGGKLVEDIDEDACRLDGVPLARRSSGGGTVLLGRGCLVYSLVLAYERHPALGEVRSSYRYVLSLMADALANLAPDIATAGTSDLASAGRKFSGNAQQRKRRHLLHHGTLLYDYDLEIIARYLKMPQRQPEYRGGRGHIQFLQNLPLEAAELKHRLRTVWKADQCKIDWPKAAVRELVTDKYDSPQWVRRR